MRVQESIVVDAPADTVYQIWRNFENFPEFMNNIEEVCAVGGGRTHWRSKGPLGRQAEWDAEVIEDSPGRAIAWRSLKKSKIQTSGRVAFADRGSSTELQVELEYEAPGGALGAIVTELFADPERQVREDLRRFKDAAERGREFSGFNYYMPMRHDEPTKPGAENLSAEMSAGPTPTSSVDGDARPSH